MTNELKVGDCVRLKSESHNFFLQKYKLLLIHWFFTFYHIFRNDRYFAVLFSNINM